MITGEELKEVIEYLESLDVKPTKENMRKVLNQWISNLYSHIGTEAHEHALACRVEDMSDMTWEEQDMQALQQIERYKKCLASISGGYHMKAVNIQWDTDGDQEVLEELPTEMEIPEAIN